MSRIGNRPIPLADGVEVKIDGQQVTINGPKGTMSRELPGFLRAEVKGGKLVLQRANEENFTKAMHGTCGSLLANMVEGVSKGYTQQLEIQGVGYRAQQQGQKVVLNLGFSHDINYQAPEGIAIAVADGTKLTVSGVDKQLVGQVSAQIRAFSPAEPYKGKGVRYKDEQVRRKAGKTVA